VILLCSRVIDNQDNHVRTAEFTAVDGLDARVVIRYWLPTKHERPLVGKRYAFREISE